MSKVKKLLVPLLCLMLALGACSGAGTTPPAETSTASAAESTAPADSAAPEAVAPETTWEGYEKSKGLSGTVSYMHFGDDYERQMYAEVFESYSKLVPDVKIEQMYTPAEYDTKLQALGASNTLPDIFWCSEARVADYADANMLTDLTPYLADYPAIHGDMIEGLKAYGDHNGVPRAIAKDWTSYVMYINKEIFSEMGVELPSKDWTMDEYREIAKQLTKTEGDRVTHYGTAVNNYRADWINFMGNFNAPWFKDGKSNISDPQALKGLSVMTGVIADGSAPSPGSVAASENGTEDRLFIIGRIGMYPSGRWVIPSFREECDFEWTAVEMPKGDTRCTPFIAGMICIGETSQNKDIAANVVSYQMSDEGLLHVMKSALAMPAYKHLLTNPDFVNTPPETDAFLATADYIGNDAQKAILTTGKWAQFNEIMRAEMSLAFEGTIPVEEAAKNIDDKANSSVFN